MNQNVTRQAKERFITDATNNYPDVSSKAYDYWANGNIRAKQCKLFFFKTSTGSIKEFKFSTHFLE